MKKILFTGLLTIILSLGQTPMKRALLLIDIQDFYFPGGKNELVNPEKAAQKAAGLLDYFRNKKETIIHIKHKSDSQADIHKTVTPLTSEKVIAKEFINSYRNTDLLDYLKKNNIDELVICGMMTHMCVQAAVRASVDYGFKVILIEDACTTKSLKYEDKTIDSEDVHFSTLAALKQYYCQVTTTEKFITE